MNPVVEADHLRKTFAEIVAVDDLSFSADAGECFGILGPNGAGKTSTIRMVYAFSPPSGGTLRVFGLDIAREARAVKSRVGVCQQENNIDPDLSVLQNLEVFARYFNIPRAEATLRAHELLRFMALEHRENARATALSGGMIRRLVIARALLNRPELLILDEPTTGLDPQSRHQVWERLEELRAGGLSLLLTTHNMDEASRLCDRLIIMDRGRLLVEGKPAELIRQHVGRHVIEVAEPASGLAAFLLERGAVFESIGHRMIVYVEDGAVLYGEIEKRFCEDGGCVMRTATLEDVFLRLTGRELRE
ncbi:MAG: ATP-binding cassette domain-containing protein [Deltaproteobacteria bacterium]|nr:ATP-binding cassette domain-containing protein [Deltaproteobacteria bacterium]